MNVLMRDMVVLGVRSADRLDAIRQAGEVLVRAGCVAPPYVDGMLAREQVQSTYLGSGIAIPHGRSEDLRLVHRTGVSVVQLPEGVEWEPGERAYLVIGLASEGMEHAGILASLVDILHMPDSIPTLIHTTDPMVIVERLTRGRSETQWN